MENYGLIVQHLRHLAGLSVQQTAKKIGKSVGWLSEVENNSGRSRLSENEFNRIVAILDGAEHRAMFKTWVAAFKSRERMDAGFDGAILKFLRIKKKLNLTEASALLVLSPSQLSKIETGLKPVSILLRNRVMITYGYSPSSWKNFSTDPVRSKAVPFRYKLAILINNLQKEEIAKVFFYAQGLADHTNKTLHHTGIKSHTHDNEHHQNIN